MSFSISDREIKPVKPPSGGVKVRPLTLKNASSSDREVWKCFLFFFFYIFLDGNYCHFQHQIWRKFLTVYKYEFRLT